MKKRGGNCASETEISRRSTQSNLQTIYLSRPRRCSSFSSWLLQVTHRRVSGKMCKRSASMGLPQRSQMPYAPWRAVSKARSISVRWPSRSSIRLRFLARSAIAGSPSSIPVSGLSSNVERNVASSRKMALRSAASSTTALATVSLSCGLPLVLCRFSSRFARVPAIRIAPFLLATLHFNYRAYPGKERKESDKHRHQKPAHTPACTWNRPGEPLLH